MSKSKNENVKNIVLALLRTNEQVRDNDRLLVREVWKVQIQQKKLIAFHTDFFLDLLYERKLALPDYITRVRRAIQEKGLYRGERWKERQVYAKKQTKSFAKDLFTLNMDDKEFMPPMDVTKEEPIENLP